MQRPFPCRDVARHFAFCSALCLVPACSSNQSPTPAGGVDTSNAASSTINSVVTGSTVGTSGTTTSSMTAQSATSASTGATTGVAQDSGGTTGSTSTAGMDSTVATGTTTSFGGASSGTADTSTTGNGGTAGTGSTGLAGTGTTGSGATGGSGGIAPLPDPGTEGDGDSMVGPNYSTQPELENQGNPQGRSYSFSMPLADSEIFDGSDGNFDPGKVNSTRSIDVYVPAAYQDGDPAPVLIIQDGPGEIGQVRNALDNLTISDDPNRRLPPFVVVAVQNGGNDAIGSERGLEYDTLSDRYARFIDLEVLPAVESEVSSDYPNLKFTEDPSGRASLGCSSGGAAAFTMAWFRPDLFSRVIAYSTTLVAQQDPDSPEAEMYPLGAWEYHSSLELIKNDTTMKQEQLRIFINVNDNDLGASDPESTYHNWVMANQRTAAALSDKGFHYKFVQGQGAGHCAAGVRNNTLADALVWAWRGYVPSGM